MKANGIKSFDGSVGYAVEHSKLSADELTRLHASAKAFASRLPTPDYEDEEHGQGPVLVLCEREAGKYIDR